MAATKPDCGPAGASALQRGAGSPTAFLCITQSSHSDTHEVQIPFIPQYKEWAALLKPALLFHGPLGMLDCEVSCIQIADVKACPVSVG